MFMCEKNHHCCSWECANRIEDIEEDCQDCGNLYEVDRIVHGKWIWSTDNYGDRVCNCSVCKEELPSVMIGRATVDNPYPETEYIEETNYCPNCGAKMI